MYVDENNVAHFTVDEIKAAAEGAAKDAADALKAFWAFSSSKDPIVSQAQLDDAWARIQAFEAKAAAWFEQKGLPAAEDALQWAGRVMACEQALKRLGAL